MSWDTKAHGVTRLSKGIDNQIKQLTEMRKRKPLTFQSTTTCFFLLIKTLACYDCTLSETVPYKNHAEINTVRVSSNVVLF